MTAFIGSIRVAAIPKNTFSNLADSLKMSTAFWLKSWQIREATKIKTAAATRKNLEKKLEQGSVIIIMRVEAD